MQLPATKTEFDDKAQRPANKDAPPASRDPVAKLIYPDQPCQRSQ